MRVEERQPREASGTHASPPGAFSKGPHHTPSPKQASDAGRLADRKPGCWNLDSFAPKAPSDSAPQTGVSAASEDMAPWLWGRQGGRDGPRAPVVGPSAHLMPREYLLLRDCGSPGGWTPWGHASPRSWTRLPQLPPGGHDGPLVDIGNLLVALLFTDPCRGQMSGAGALLHGGNLFRVHGPAQSQARLRGPRHS